MAESDGHEAQVYQLRAVLRGISPLNWRRLLLRSDSTVAQLHEVLESARRLRGVFLGVGSP